MKAYLRLTCTLLLTVVLLYSCAPLKYPNRANMVSLKDSLTALNGDYKNLVSDTGYDYDSFWGVLTLDVKRGIYSRNYHYPLSFVKLSVINNHRVEATLYADSAVVEKLLLKGHVKANGYFATRVKLRWIGLPPIFWIYGARKLQIGLHESNRLYVDAVRSSAGWVLLFMNGVNDWRNFSFEPHSRQLLPGYRLSN